MTVANAYISLAMEGRYRAVSEVKSSGAVQFIGAPISENGSSMIAFNPKSPSRARGGWSSLIRIFDYMRLQQGVGIDNCGGEAYPTNGPVH